MGCRAAVDGPKTPPGDPAGKGFEEKPVPAVGAAPGERYAVCIGVSSYRNLPDLRFAHLDAEDVYDFLLSDAGGFDVDHCVLLCDANAEGGRVLKKQMESLFTTWMARVQPQDMVFIFYSGHGLPRGRDGAFMAGWDTDPGDLYPTAIPMERMREYLNRQIAAERVVVVLDTCFSGAVGGKTYLPGGQRAGAFDQTVLDRVAGGKGRVILTASTGRQAAHEIEELGHGIFTYCMLNGLKGAADLDRDRRVTLSELWLYLQKTVQQEAGRRGLRQVPVLRGEQIGEIVLAMRRKIPAQDPTALDGPSAEAVVFLLQGIHLKKEGFHEKALDQFRKARPHVPVENRAFLEALMEECRTAALAEDPGKKGGERLPQVSEGGGAASLAGTRAESDFRAGQRAEAEGLITVAVAYYEAALEAAPDEKKPPIRERIEACRLTERAEALYGEIRRSYEEAEAHPSREAYRNVLSKIADLERLDRGVEYRKLGLMKVRAEEENTSDASRKYFGFGVKARDAGKYREAHAWFEKAKEGAGGRYPEEIERNIGYCRISLEQEIEGCRLAAQAAFFEGRLEECIPLVETWLGLEPGSMEAESLHHQAVAARAQALFDAGDYGRCRAFTRRAIALWPDDGALKTLIVRAEAEDLPAGARAAWEQALQAEKTGDFGSAADALSLALEAPPGEGFNAHYRRLARPRLEETRWKAFEQYQGTAQDFMDAGEYGKALAAAERALEYRPGFEPLIRLKEELAEKALALEAFRYRAAKEAEKAEGIGSFSTAETKEQRAAVDRVLANYQAYLESFPGGRWSGEVRTALKRLEAMKQGYRPVQGFEFLRVETFACGGRVNTVPIYRHQKSKLEFVLLPGGRYGMGSPPGEAGRYRSESTPHPVTVKPFLICRTECTRAGWDAAESTGRPLGDGFGSKDPVARVSWEDCVYWCKKAGLRLPTETEREYACRGGTETAFCHGESTADLAAYSWYNANAYQRAHPVGGKKPNAFGLFDMHGNLWEWCRDIYPAKGSSNGPARNPRAAMAKPNRVIRGGGWNFSARDCRSARRSGDPPNIRSGVLGFRPACSLE